MDSYKLRAAREYEIEKEKMISEEDRPSFHLSARVGWMNDPNGFSYYDGKYHMFYQYHPYDSHWGPMHWGHAVSEDLIHWEYLPVALAPDEWYDNEGIFSGGATTLDDGSHLLMYTGVTKELQKNGEYKVFQRQCIAVGNGKEYQKYKDNPVITEDILPEGMDISDFRDPHLFKVKDGYRVMLAANKPGHGGVMLVYRSKDGFKWEFDKVFAENEYRLGLMWECPDFFESNGEYVLLGSAQDMLPKGMEYSNGMGTFYMTGSFDTETETFTEHSNHAVDYGMDFYAPQTLVTKDGRRVMMAWMQNWDTCNMRTKSIPWFGQMTFPREIWMEDGTLMQRPIREIEQYRTNKVSYEDVYVKNEEIMLEGIEGRVIDLEVEISAVDKSKIFQKFAVHFAENDQFYTAVSFRPHESTLRINRKHSGSRRAIIHQRRTYVSHDYGKLKLRILLDKYSAEIFINDGERTMTATFYTDLDAKSISFFVLGEARFSVTKYDLKP